MNFKQHILPHLIAIGAFLLLTFAYMPSVLKGKVLQQQDITQFLGSAKEAMDYTEKTGKTTLWTNSMFGGMPTYQITGGYENNMFIVGAIYRFFTKTLPKPTNILFLLMLGFYLLLIFFGVGTPLGIIGAIAFAFSSNNLISIEAGHMTKVLAMSLAPFVVAGVVLTIKKKRILIGGVLTALFLAFQINANHLQITYYLFLFLLIFMVIEFIGAIKRGDLNDFIKGSAVLLVAAILGVGANASKLLTTYEYSKETTRGASELTIGNENASSGLDIGYATNWSYGLGETWTFLIPNARGGTSMEVFLQDENSETTGAFRRMQGKIRDQQLLNSLVNSTNHYWGEQPFTAGPIYFGATICFLFVLALFLVKGPRKWWLVGASIFAVILSWGHNAQGITEFFFNNFPFYNKFRTVTMILYIAELAFPLLAILALYQIFFENPSKEKVRKALIYSGAIVGGITLLFAIMPGVFFDFISQENDKLLIEKAPSVLDAMQADREALLTSDAFRSLIFIALTFGALFFFNKGNVKANIAMIAIGGLILVDLWAVDKRYLNEDDFISKRKQRDEIPMSQADAQILKDPDPNYRVLNLTVSIFNDATTSYYHKSIGGYHGAKLGRYQELITYGISPEFNLLRKGNLQEAGVLNMLNTKYLISGRGANGVFKNPFALGNAWFVDNLQKVQNADEEITKITEIDPSNTALYDERYEDYVQGFDPEPSPSSSIELTKYEPNYLTYKVNTSSPQFAVFSEIYYNSGKGWEAFIDGEPAKHIRVNYVLRGMKIPEGDHVIEFKFNPKTVRVYEKASLFSSLLLLIALIGALAMEFKQYKDKEKTVEQ